MWLNNDHACLAIEHLLIRILEVIVDFQVEVVHFVEISNDTNKVACFDPELDGPAPPKRHLKEDGALNEASQDRLPILIHGRT